MMPNMGGPKQRKRRLLGTVAQCLQARERLEHYEGGRDDESIKAVKMARKVAGRHKGRMDQNITQWMGRKHGEVTFHLTQALSGHGCFGKYFHRIARKENQKYCLDEDDPKHTVLRCHRWATKKQDAEAKLCEILEPKNLERWNVVAGFITSILKQKETDERRIQREEN
ncbi:PREDICTED: uncharacterized protein LOC108563875 [Nicrophorus vespilloides]|uniref:Uncharacterized protein LOC108563875 n=1 Tax=Nicrophorus vespilloides TaxID=110193 RepID=A0ABM1MUB7_NICVS|nr:PREDICTED: uncharacterized protein LOC108563875 [Nicrophorus vespilloides]